MEKTFKAYLESANIFQYAAHEEKMFEAYLEDMGGNYKRKTTFYSDLSIAEYFGDEEIKDTYKNVCASWINDSVYFTEFVMCLNLKSWEWAENGNRERSELYANLYYEAMDKFYEKYEGNEKALNYFYAVLD